MTALFFISKVRTCQEYVPLPHVFPPSAIRQSPTGRATLGSRTLSDVASLCHLSLWCKKNRAHQRLRTNSGARRSLPRRRCSSRSVFEQVSACITTQRIGIVQNKKALRGECFLFCWLGLVVGVLTGVDAVVQFDDVDVDVAVCVGQ